VKTKATRVSDKVFFKHQYITNPQVTPKTLVIKVVLDLTSALKGTVLRDGKTAEALKKFSTLLTKTAAAKSATAKAKEQQNNLQTHPNARQAVPLQRVVKRPTIMASPIPRVLIAIAEADCHIRDSDKRVQMVGRTSWVTVMPTQTVERVTLQQGACRPLIMRPNYISQDDDNNEPNHRYNTRSPTTSIMQEAILACIDITKPRFEISVAKLATQKFLRIWFCKTANSVLGKQGEILEYCHLIVNPNTRATWTHSYGNELGWLAQGMPGRVMGMDMIFFITRVRVPRTRAKDVMHSLITCLIRPEKTKKPNRTR
jgi:hypothetical protein